MTLRKESEIRERYENLIKQDNIDLNSVVLTGRAIYELGWCLGLRK